jgi:hypothetical protein
MLACSCRRNGSRTACMSAVRDWHACSTAAACACACVAQASLPEARAASVRAKASAVYSRREPASHAGGTGHTAFTCTLCVE